MDAGRAFREFRRGARLPDPPFGGMIDISEQSDGGEVRLLGDLGEPANAVCGTSSRSSSSSHSAVVRVGPISLIRL